MQIQKNNVITDGKGLVFRVLEVRENESLMVDCYKKKNALLD
jgi:hypothetical protein